MLYSLRRTTLGLYVLVEGYDRSFLKRHFKNPNGNFYDSGFFQEITDPLEITTGDGAKDRSDLKALVEAAREADPNKRLERLATVLDLERFYSYLAVEVMVSSRDGYALNKNNYRVYHDPNTKRCVFIPSGMDQLFVEPMSPLLADCSGLVAAVILYTTEARERYRQRCASLFTNVFRVSYLTNLLPSMQQRLRPVLASITADAAQQHDAAADQLRQRVINRILHLTDEMNSPVSPRFDSDGTASLGSWRPQITIGTSELLKVTNGIHSLSIKCIGGHALSISSWRTRFTLPKGQYRFEAKVRADGLMPMRNAPGGGVLIRVFARGSSPVDASMRNGEWQQLSTEFNIEDIGVQEEFICEVRAYKGVVAFDEDSLKLIRVSGKR